VQKLEWNMITLIKMLMAGTYDVVDKFIAAEDFWKNFFKMYRDGDVKMLADALGAHQMEFETKLDWHRDLAKQIMPYSCLAYLYDESSGFGDDRDLAYRIVKAFAGSKCSTEVKWSAEEAAKRFGFDDRVATPSGRPNAISALEPFGSDNGDSRSQK
jgi:hypothetical protein